MSLPAFESFTVCWMPKSIRSGSVATFFAVDMIAATSISLYWLKSAMLMRVCETPREPAALRYT